MPQPDLVQEIEAVLFVSSEPVSLPQLVAATESSTQAVTTALEELDELLQNRGIQLVHAAGRYSLASHSAAAAAVERFLGANLRGELSQPALETLAIIAYRQPVTKTDIENVRGVASDQIIRNLIARGLVTAAPKDSGGAKRYEVTARFLQHFGLSRSSDLPALAEIPEVSENKDAA